MITNLKNPMSKLTVPELKLQARLYEEIRDGYPRGSGEYRYPKKEIQRIKTELALRKKGGVAPSPKGPALLIWTLFSWCYDMS